MHTLIIFFDPHCGLCNQFRHWMLSQASSVRLEFLPYHSDAARELLPELPALHPEKEIVVMNNEGEIWQGGHAWIVCLWALRDWRPWAKRLASPALLPLARKICHLISSNRLTLSKMLQLNSNADLTRELEKEPVACPDGGCRSKQKETKV